MSKKAWLIVGGIGLFFLVSGLIISTYYKGSSDVAYRFVKSASEGKIDAAWKMTTAEFREKTSLKAFEKLIAPLRGLARFTPRHQSLSFRRGWVRGVAKSRDGRHLQLAIFLRKQQKVWKISGLKISENAVGMANNFLRQLREGKFNDAWLRTSSVYRKRVDEQAFVALVKKLELQKNRSVVWRVVDSGKHRATVQGTLTLSGGSSFRLRLVFENENGKWMVNTIATK